MSIGTNFKKAAAVVARRKQLCREPVKIVRPKSWHQAKGTVPLPKWAEQIIKRELKGIQKAVYVAWSETPAGRGSGRAYGNKYSRVEGRWVGPALTMRNNVKDPLEQQKALTIHEVCHLKVGLTHSHDEVFTAEVIRMYRKYGLLEWVDANSWEYPSINKAIKKALARSKGKKPTVKAAEPICAEEAPVEEESKQVPQSHSTRETWLHAAATIFRPWFQKFNVDYPEKLRISCGLAGGRIGAKTLGECWSDKCSSDQAREVFISPEMDNPSRVLDVLIHELCHACLPFEVKHGKPFKKLASGLGLEGKMTATIASSALEAKLADVIAEIGPYPHAALHGIVKKKQGTRMLKIVCPGCGYTVRTTAKWIEHGMPTCCCGEEMEADQ
jgi:hypothetical protein